MSNPTGVLFPFFNLISFSLSVSRPPDLTSKWICIEGAPAAASAADPDCSVPYELPQQQQTGQLPQRYLNYFAVVSKSLLCDDDASPELASCLQDLRSNRRISPLLPALVTFIRNGIQKYPDNHRLLGRFLKVLEAIFDNRGLNLSPKPIVSGKRRTRRENTPCFYK